MKIGKLDLPGNVLLAPMAGITDPPFRRVVQHFGVSALWTEMISAQGLLRSPRTCATMELTGHQAPTVFQLFGTDPMILAEAARRVEGLGAAAVDVNMGCPVRKVINKGAGAALMNNVPLAGAIVRAIRKAVSLTLTVKIRAGWDETSQNAAEVAQVVEAEGADAVIVHSRFRSRVHSGPPSLHVLQEVKSAVGIPVVGNGGITDVQDAIDMVAHSGCDGVMVGRGALGRPWLPAQILAGFGHDAKPHPEHEPAQAPKLLGVVRLHFQYQFERCDILTAVRRMRKHLAWYGRGLPNASEFRRTVFKEDDPERVMELLEHWFADAAIG